MKSVKAAILLLYLLLFPIYSAILAGCGRVSIENRVLARVGDIEITVGDFNKRISHLPERYREIIKKRKPEFLEDIISDVLLYQESKRLGVDKSRDVRETVEEAKKKIVIAKYIQDNVDDAVKITDDDIKKEYEENQAAYMMPSYLRASHVLVRTQEEANAVLAELKKGVSFEDVARSRSFDPTAQDGGDIGYFIKGQLMPEFENACASLAVGEVSEPVRTKLGYHVIKMTDRRESAARPIDEVSDRIRAVLMREKKREKFNELMNELRRNTKIEVNEKALEQAGNI